jgi:hypothetical protein
MHHPRDAVVDPSPISILYRLANEVQADLLVMVATNSEDRCNSAQLGNQIAEYQQLGATVYQVAPQQHHVRTATSGRIQDLPAERH